MVDALEALVALNLTGLVGRVLHDRLVDAFGSAASALRAPPSALRRIPGIGEITSAAIAEVARSGEAAREIDLAARRGIRLVAWKSPGYPPALTSLHDPPLVLYAKGDLIERDALAIGLVGSREATAYGLRQADRFACDLAGMGVTVVSGLARGVDTAAHRGALRPADGRTAAVLGSGLLRMYPPENARLAAAIAERGAVLSEFPLEAGPEASRFPRRNRLISGLSLGLLIVEAAEKSGALITADWAMEQGRDVFCLPGSVENPMSRGCHLLIKQGARLAEEAIDLFQEIPAFAPLLQRIATGPPLSPLERAVLGELAGRPRTAESIAAATRLPECAVEAALQRLALRGLAGERTPDTEGTERDTEGTEKDTEDTEKDSEKIWRALKRE